MRNVALDLGRNKSEVNEEDVEEKPNEEEEEEEKGEEEKGGEKKKRKKEKERNLSEIISINCLNNTNENHSWHSCRWIYKKRN